MLMTWPQALLRMKITPNNILVRDIRLHDGNYLYLYKDMLYNESGHQIGSPPENENVLAFTIIPGGRELFTKRYEEDDNTLMLESGITEKKIWDNLKRGHKLRQKFWPEGYYIYMPLRGQGNYQIYTQLGKSYNRAGYPNLDGTGLEWETFYDNTRDRSPNVLYRDEMVQELTRGYAVRNIEWPEGEFIFMSPDKNIYNKDGLLLSEFLIDSLYSYRNLNTSPWVVMHPPRNSELNTPWDTITHYLKLGYRMRIGNKEPDSVYIGTNEYTSGKIQPHLVTYNYQGVAVPLPNHYGIDDNIYIYKPIIIPSDKQFNYGSAIRRLFSNQMVRCVTWPKGKYLYTRNEEVLTQDNHKMDLPIKQLHRLGYMWEIYEEEKIEVKSESLTWTEALEFLKQGFTIRHKFYDTDTYLFMRNSVLYHQDGIPVSHDFRLQKKGWLICGKRVIKGE